MPRADLALVKKGLAKSRTQAQAMIMAGTVFLDHGKRILKAGQIITPEDMKNLNAHKPHPWVSRAALKLEHAITHFCFSPKGKIGLDIGTSTGGFTQIMLHYGAIRVYSVDTGRGQIAWSLRQDKRVILHENTNARYITDRHIPEAPAFIACDVSFISVKKILPTVLPFAAENAELVVLIKPQFEAGREHITRGGIVRDETIHKKICDDITAHLKTYPDWSFKGLCESPIVGAKGNREFLLVAKRITL